MSTLKKLKSLFIEQDESETAEGKGEIKQTQNSTSAKAAPQVKPITSSGKVLSGEEVMGVEGIEGKADNKIVDTLLSAVEKNDLEGFDYLEFKKSLQSMKKMSMSEELMYQSAFATASTMGVTLDKLIETAQYYIKIMDKEMHNFGEAVARQNNEMVVKRKEQSLLVEEQLASKEKQIELLQKEIVTLKEKQAKLKGEIEQSSIKIEQTKANFEKSFLHLRQQFESDIVKMQKYLK